MLILMTMIRFFMVIVMSSKVELMVMIIMVFLLPFMVYIMMFKWVITLEAMVVIYLAWPVEKIVPMTVFIMLLFLHLMLRTKMMSVTDILDMVCWLLMVFMCVSIKVMMRLLVVFRFNMMINSMMKFMLRFNKLRMLID